MQLKSHIYTWAWARHRTRFTVDSRYAYTLIQRILNWQHLFRCYIAFNCTSKHNTRGKLLLLGSFAVSPSEAVFLHQYYTHLLFRYILYECCLWYAQTKRLPNELMWFNEMFERLVINSMFMPCVSPTLVLRPCSSIYLFSLSRSFPLYLLNHPIRFQSSWCSFWYYSMVVHYMYMS